MCNLRGKGPKCDEVCARFDSQNRPRTQWWDRAPGWYWREFKPEGPRTMSAREYALASCGAKGVAPDMAALRALVACVRPNVVPLCRMTAAQLKAELARQSRRLAGHLDAADD